MRYIPPILLFLLLVACPKPPEQLDPAICDDGYHPCGPDSQECCLDTTSHEFSWQLDTIGNYASWINDFAIISEDDIWAVGNIIMPDLDSGANVFDTEMFNAAHWDGNTWQVIAIDMLLEINNTIIRPELSSIHPFSDNDIWVTTGGFPVHWDGTSWTHYQLLHMGLGIEAGYDAFGISSDDMYFVGYQGGIAHYNGSNFQRMESGTDLDLLSIAGSEDGEHLFAVGFDNLSAQSIIIEYANSTWSTLYYNQGIIPTQGNMGALYPPCAVLGDTAYFSSVKGLWKYNYITGESNLLEKAGDTDLRYLGLEGILANSSSDIGVFTTQAKLLHFNGDNWRIDKTVTDIFGEFHITCKGTDFNNNTVASVGYVYFGSYAYIALGTR